MNEIRGKMKVEIWSDIACPFCYIGKKHYEKALEQFDGRDYIDLHWYSYQLDPGIGEKEERSMSEYLEQSKGISARQIEEMFDNIKEMGSACGIEFNFEQAIIANTKDAHRVLQLAKSKGLSDAAEEAFFKAYFTQGKDLGDPQELIRIGKEVGLDSGELEEVVASDKFSYQVNQDIREAGNIGVRGVPFFVFNRKYGLSGAQPVEAFLQTLNKAHQEWRSENPGLQMQGGSSDSCGVDGNCD